METTTKTKSFADIVTKEPLVLVDFYTEWCGPCKMMKPVLEELKGTIGDKAKIVKVDVEKNPRAAARFNITGVPTLILFRNGKIAWRQSGVIAPSVLKRLIETTSQ